jgi:hypothetical protein
LHAVDPHTGIATPAEVPTEEAFRRNIRNARLEDVVSTVVLDSIQAARQWTGGSTVSMLFIDGEHTDDAVWNDGSAWESFLLPEAFVVFDDLNRVRGGVDRLRAAGFIASEIGVVGKMGIFGKRQSLNPRAQNLLASSSSRVRRFASRSGLARLPSAPR